jgi:hypothetical protein
VLDTADRASLLIVHSTSQALAAVAALAAGLAGQDRATVRAELGSGEIPGVYVSLNGLLDNDHFVSAMESGFPLHVVYKVELRQSRSMWDRTVARAEWDFVVLYDPVRERFVLEDPYGTEVLPSRSQLRDRLNQVYFLELAPDQTGEFYYSAAVDAATLEDEDVDEVFEWLRGESADSLRRKRPGFITRTARSLLVRIAPLPRVTVQAQSNRFTRP